MNIQTVEDHIKAEFGIVRAFIALHPYISTAVALVAGGALGHFI